MNGRDWFSVDRIDPETFVISENRHWEQTHCYLLTGTEGALLIDTGMGISNLRALTDTLTEYPLQVVSTHAHWDHIGGHSLFDAYMVHEAERSWLEGDFPLPLSLVKNALVKEPCPFPESFDINRYQIFQGTPARILRDGDFLDLGNRTLRVLHTPGHSPGHCCFYEPAREYLVSGDLLYAGKLDAFYPTTDPIKFMASVERVRALPVGRILPGHHSLDLPKDLADRVFDGFRQIQEVGRLRHGGGIFDFGLFIIHV